VHLDAEVFDLMTVWIERYRRRAEERYRRLDDVLAAMPDDAELIVRDAQGMRGKKIEIYSLSYSAINMWSSENARGILDLNGEIELWTRAGHLKVDLAKGIDVRRLDKLIANAVLGNGLRSRTTVESRLAVSAGPVGVGAGEHEGEARP
jgi:hypothetical protein